MGCFEANDVHIGWQELLKTFLGRKIGSGAFAGGSGSGPPAAESTKGKGSEVEAEDGGRARTPGWKAARGWL